LLSIQGFPVDDLYHLHSTKMPLTNHLFATQTNSVFDLSSRYSHRKQK
jgi:hypothetical protein